MSHCGSGYLEWKYQEYRKLRDKYGKLWYKMLKIPFEISVNWKHVYTCDQDSIQNQCWKYFLPKYFVALVHLLLSETCWWFLARLIYKAVFCFIIYSPVIVTNKVQDFSLFENCQTAVSAFWTLLNFCMNLNGVKNIFAKRVRRRKK